MIYTSVGVIGGCTTCYKMNSWYEYLKASSLLEES